MPADSTRFIRSGVTSVNVLSANYSIYAESTRDWIELGQKQRTRAWIELGQKHYKAYIVTQCTTHIIFYWSSGSSQAWMVLKSFTCLTFINTNFLGVPKGRRLLLLFVGRRPA